MEVFAAMAICATYSKPNTLIDAQSLYQDKASMDMSLIEFKYLFLTCWNERYHPLTIDMAMEEYTGLNEYIC